ncbi:MAG: lysozyme inhibitor LprI family protein [Jhaorihella sp.]
MKRVGASVLVLALWALSASAQSLVYSDMATLTCLSQTARASAKQDCIGASANACMSATPDGGTTVGMGGCLDRELAFWDGMLNRNYQALRDRAKRTDAEMRDLGASVTWLGQSLRDMQRAWIVWRDATCDFERAQWGGGTGGGPATYACLMRLTGQQALYLGDAWLGE